MTERFCNFTVAAALAVAITAISLQPAAARDDDGKGRRGGLGHHDLSFAELDADGDGQLTEQELAAAKQVWLQKHDSDGDGALSPEEAHAAIMVRLSAVASRMIEKWFERLDSDEDGLIGADELAEMHSGRRGFDHFDSDDDGMISEAEFNTQKQKRKNKRRRHRDR